jgi:hypothetical protein
MELESIHFTIIVISFSIVLVFGWWSTLHFLKNKPEVLVALFHGGWVIKFIAVIFIVVATSILAVIGKIEGSAAVALLSAIAGYVLGASTSKEKENPKTEE